MKQYGISKINFSSSETDLHFENILRRGYTILKSVLTLEECNILIEKSESIYLLQKEEFQEHNLKLISETDVVRAPLYYDEYFIETILKEKVFIILKQVFNSQFILHLQNVIINRPNTEHQQISWHRDIPYQEYTVSRPIAINAFYCLSPFNEQTGATKILPYSHLKEDFPSTQFVDENAIFVNADPGDVIMFDSWLYHRASYNKSDSSRYGLNHVYTVPILKQQIDLPKFLRGKYQDHSLLKTLLGYTFDVPQSVLDFRIKKIQRINSLSSNV